MTSGNWAELIIEELYRCGLNTCFIAPGSRSTALVSAIARHPEMRAIMHFDERGTAYAAIGYARFTGSPAIWVTTSGTAVANGLPAVVEASMDNVPVFLLTADRPPELRDTGANQTIHQPGIFGRYTRWFFDMPVQDDNVDPAFVLTTIDHAVHRCRSESGPVHINCMFRKPLELSSTPNSGREGKSSPYILSRQMDRWAAGSSAFTSYADVSPGPGNTKSVSQLLASSLAESTRPIIVLGGGANRVSPDIAEWASRKKIPVFPDVSSRYRMNDAPEAVIPFWGVSRSRVGDEPDLIIQFGSHTVSTCWDVTTATKIVIDAGSHRYDPGHRVTHRITMGEAGVSTLIQDLESVSLREPTWMNEWICRSRIVQKTLNGMVDGQSGGATEELTEELVAHMLPGLLPADSNLMIGNSMPIRHMDKWAGVSGDSLAPFVSRGTSGIDGLVAQAAGLKVASGQPTAIFLGDQSLLHDMNSLALAKKLNLLVVVLNNNGGRIFHHLPIAQQGDVLESYFVDPHGLDFEHAAAQFGIHYTLGRTIESFRNGLANFGKNEEATIIEVPIKYQPDDVSGNVLEARVSQALKQLSED
jgi:2-succinyl-5-enolpyruvyl-6-hydroxy-3-cyclohexene-1-carboxylate synthase